MTSVMPRIGACLFLVCCLTAVGHADEAGAVKQIRKQGGSVVNLGAGTMVIFDGKKFSDSHVNLLAEFKNLTTVRFNDANVTDAGLKVLGRLKQLTDVRFLNTKISDAGLKELRGLDNLEILFDTALEVEPLRLLQVSSRNRTIVASWSGDYRDSTLTYAEPGHPEFVQFKQFEAIVIPVGKGSADCKEPTSS